MTQYYSALDYYFLMLGQMLEFYRSILSDGFIYAIFIFVVGAILGIEFSKMTTKTLKEAGVDKFLDKAGFKSFLKKGGFKISISNTAGWIIKWFIILLFLTVAVDSLNLPRVSEFLFDIMAYLPSLIGGLAILTVGVIVAQMVGEALDGISKSTNMRIYHLSGMVAKTMIIIVTVLVVLEQIGIETSILQIFAGGFALMFGLAGGLAFGLGGQYLAKDILDEMQKKIKE